MPGSMQALIESMALYVHVERIYAELAQMGIGPTDLLRPDQLYPFDQLHYHGVDAVRQMARQLALDEHCHVLDVGSGLGGAARCLAQEFECRVTAIELQPALHDVGTSLTARCGLDGQVRHVRGNALTHALPVSSFDAAAAIMVLHHVPERAHLLHRLASLLRPTGTLFIEDLFVRAALSDAATREAERLLVGPAMTDRATYEAHLRDAGFTHIAIDDTTDDWGPYCADRSAAFRADRTRFVRVHGVELFDRLDDFLSGVARLFAGGSLGGLRITARTSEDA